MRVLFFILVLANLLFLGWANWIDVPLTRPDTLAGMTRLQLVKASPPARASAATPAPVGALGDALAAQAGTSGGSQAAPPRCVSLGPFVRHAAAARMAAALRSERLEPQERIAPVRPATWYWVYLPGLGSPARIQGALTRLKQAGIHGAEPMRTADGTGEVSLGMFQARTLARRLLTRARAKGIPVRLAERLVAQPQYWLDLWIPGGMAAPAIKALSATIGGTFAARTCPAGVRAPDHATGPVSPGMPMPSDRASAAPAAP
jgi:hypothetical protein